MDATSRIVCTQTILEEFCAVLADEDAIAALPLTITGSSMTPFLVHGRDTVYLSRCPQTLTRGDVVLYRRKNGNYILHRIHSVQGDSFTMVGDAHTVLEPGIGREQILAIMTSARRKGKLQKPGTFWWEFFRSVWLRILPLRRPVMKVYAALKGSKH